MSFAIPTPLKLEHDHLHDHLRAAIAKGGRTGDAARRVADLLHPHFVAEEEFALPPLGLLASLAREAEGVSGDDARQARAMAERLSAEMPRMLDEHREIVGALGSLRAAALDEGHKSIVTFTDALVLHARTEEEVLYPATILLGRYLALKAGAGVGSEAGRTN